MMFRTSERRCPSHRLRRPARLAVLVLAPIVLLWASGAALPGVRGDLAALAPGRRGTLPRSAQATAIRILNGEVLVAPAAGRFYPAVADGTAVAGRAAVARIQGLSAPALARAARSATRALAGGSQTPARQGLLAQRAAAARGLAAAATADVVVPVAGTLRWHLPASAGSPIWRRSPEPGQWVAAGQRLGVVVPPVTAWAVLAPGGALAGLQLGARVRLTPPGLAGRVTRTGGGRVDVAAGPARAGAGGRPLPVALAWGSVAGVVVPAGAVVRRGGSAWVLAAGRFAGRLRWRRVSVLASFGGLSALGGLSAGAWVAARPWLAGLWAAWP